LIVRCSRFSDERVLVRAFTLNDDESHAATITALW